MRMVTSILLASSLAIAAPIALADDLVISPEIGVHFHDDVKVKKYKARSWDGDVKVGVVLPADIELYNVPEKVVVSNVRLQGHKYVYLNDRIYLVDSDRRVVAIVD